MLLNSLQLALVLVQLAALSAISRAAQCYHPDGSTATSDYQPCNPSGRGMCCATNRNNAFINKCRPDSLCLEEATGNIWRLSCTDPTWKDAACLQLCTQGYGPSLASPCLPLAFFKLTSVTFTVDGSNGGPPINMTQTDIIITLCGDGSYCCGQANSTCCAIDQGFWIDQGKVFGYTSSPFTSASAANAPTSGCAAPTSTALGDILSCGGHGDTKKVAMGVSLGIGIPILILLASILFLLASRNRRTAVAPTGAALTTHSYYMPPKESEAELRQAPGAVAELEAR
jgi:hypothetical protein